jgi:hypothetical protein
MWYQEVWGPADVDLLSFGEEVADIIGERHPD